MLEKANNTRKKKTLKDKNLIYETICNNYEITSYRLSKIIGFSNGKIDYHLKKLLQEELIKKTVKIINGRVNYQYSILNKNI